MLSSIRENLIIISKAVEIQEDHLDSVESQFQSCPFPRSIVPQRSQQKSWHIYLYLSL